MFRHFFAKEDKLFNPIQRKYGEQTDIFFPLYTQSGNDTFYEASSIATGDIYISIDGVTDSVKNSNNAASKYSNIMIGIYKLTLDASEMTGQSIQIRIEDTDAAKVYKDTFIGIETYGHDNARHRMDMDFPTMALNFTSTAATTTTTLQCSSLDTSADDRYIDRAIIFKGGNLDNRVAFIEDYTASTTTLTITQVHSTVASGQEFFIL